MPDSKKVAIIQSNYIPWKGYFDIINAVDEFILYDEMQYTKNDWRNRNKIKTNQGVAWLTIPVRQETLQQRIDETLIFDEKWALKHWRTLAQAYAKAPHFKIYKDTFEALYTGLDTRYLSQINFALIQTTCQLLGITTKLSWSSDYELGEGKTERLVKLVQDAGGTEYVSGPAARGYLETELFEQAGLQVSWMDYDNYPEYPQLHGGPFEHGVSMLDLLFNMGPEAPQYMKTFANQLSS
ncbi:WbqC family protein [Hymenobacter sp. BT175]|uniref:WbqC family protein n=1 Tax=Hymenobacter translucens TaxID=2886507 RepID=UPI001D0F1100|nr:WbqC family protein [Hymenobacter translucens]MCC2547905.1 WbqC family protein [Hymenobacter translucens]